MKPKLEGIRKRHRRWVSTYPKNLYPKNGASIVAADRAELLRLLDAATKVRKRRPSKKAVAAERRLRLERDELAGRLKAVLHNRHLLWVQYQRALALLARPDVPAFLREVAGLPGDLAFAPGMSPFEVEPTEGA